MLGLVFPGQGSQQIGMGKFLYDNFPLAKQCYEESSDAISVDLKKLCFADSDAKLNLTEFTQPALLCTSVAYFRAFNAESPIDFICSAGHSLGEYSALVCNGVISLKEACQIVRARGKAMQEAVPIGTGSMMAVLGLTDEQVQVLLEYVDRESGLGPLQAANYNAPGQVVISGQTKACEWLKNNFKPEILTNSARVKFIPLKVSAPFHCSMMMPAQEKMALLINDSPFKDAHKPIIQNVNAKAVTKAHELKVNIIEQISSAVKWVDCVSQMKNLGVSDIIELGPSKVLSGLIKKIDPDNLNCFNVHNLDEFKALCEKLGKA